MTNETGAVSAQSVLNRKKTENIIKRAATLEKPVFSDDVLGKRAEFFKAEDGFFDVTLHGENKLAYFFGEKIDSSTLARIIKERKDYSGQPVRLLSCNTGCKDENGDCFAQRLADELKTEVIAPNNFLWAHRVVNGISEVTVGSAPFSDDGEFVMFRPR